MPKSDPMPDLSHPDAEREEWLYWLASTRTSIRQIRRWVGWIVALMVLTIVLEFFSGVLVALIEEQPEPEPQRTEQSR